MKPTFFLEEEQCVHVLILYGELFSQEGKLVLATESLLKKYIFNSFENWNTFIYKYENVQLNVLKN